jgi:hypothetical protein
MLGGRKSHGRGWGLSCAGRQVRRPWNGDFFSDCKEPSGALVVARVIVGPDVPHRQVVVKVPFADQRAEEILAAEAKQLPRDESTLVTVDVRRHPTAFESWGKRVPERFTPTQQTRVGGVLLFSRARWTLPGMPWVSSVRLMCNPHALNPVPDWLVRVVDEARAEAKHLTGRPD